MIFLSLYLPVLAMLHTEGGGAWNAPPPPPQEIRIFNYKR